MRRRLTLAGAALALAGAVWVAAPAMSLTRYAPKPVDFEQGLPHPNRLKPKPTHAHGATHAHRSEGPVRFASPVIEAPREFDLVGIAGEVRPYEIRVRDDDGWSEWLEVSDGNPIYAGGADQTQVRSRSFEPDGELHYVNVSGTGGGTADRLLNAARGAINEAFISVASTPVAEAIAPRPPVVSRAAWGADRTDGGGCTPKGPPTMGTVNSAVIHHTVSATDYLPEEAPGLVLGICRFHVNGNGWSDIGYNALVDSYGQLYEGRAGGLNRPVVGAHTAGVNSTTTGLASIGTHSTILVNPTAQWTMVQYLAWKLARHGAVPASIAGHRQFNPTSCPGNALQSQIPAIRSQVQKRIKKYAKNKKKGKRKKR
jgi:hypothetical protein